MLFQSGVPQVIQQMNFRADTLNTLARKTDAAKRLDFYHGEQLTRLEEQLNALFSDPSAMVKTHLNIVRKIIDNLAQTYREPPKRTLEGTEKDIALYSEIVEQCNLDVRMKQISRYVKLLKTILVRPTWRRDQLDLDILTGNILDVETGDTPEELLRVLVTNYGSSDKIEDITYSLWDSETWTRLDYRGNMIEQAPNPYGVLPFLPIFDFAPPSSQFWLPGGSDLVSLQEAVNLKLTDLLYLLSSQAFGVGWVKSSGQGGGSIRVDPGSLVELPENGALGFESQKAEIQQVVNAIDKLIKWACVSNGLSAASMSTDPSEASGLSKIFDTRELSEMRTDDIALFRSYEKKLFDLMRIVWNTHSSKNLSETATLSIDFADPKAEVDVLTQVKADELLLEMGVISAVDIVMERNADITSREEAVAYLLKIREEARLLSE